MLVTFGAPYRGSLNAFDFLANGLRKSIGPLDVPSGSTRSSARSRRSTN